MRRLMSRTRALFVCLLLAGAPAALRAQTPTPTPTPTATPSPTPTAALNTTPTGQTWTTDGAASANGSRVAHTADGSTWFMTSLTDRIVRLQGETMTEWPIRDSKNLGANPVDFQLDGDVMWFIENGESLIDAGKSIVARLDTTTGALREWVLPLSRPAGIYRTPDGKKIWVAQTAGVLELLDLDTLAVLDYRAAPKVTYAAALTLGPDGALWMIDFGNNRIVRHDLGDNSETAWTILDPAQFLLNPSDMRFDENGYLWITEFSGARVDRFNPADGVLRAYPGFSNPIHLDLLGGNIYVSEETGGQGQVAILDPRVAPYTTQTLTPEILQVGTLVRPPATFLDSVITPITFTSTKADFAATDLTIAAGTPGIMGIDFNKTNAFGIAVDGGAIWVGSNGFLVRLVPQSIGGPTDQTVPVALQFGSPPDTIRVNLTLYNRGSTALSGNALYQYSAGTFPRSKAFTVGPGETVLLEDAFAGAFTAQSLSLGPVRFQVTEGQASDLVASVRSALVLANSGTFGFALPAQTAAESLQAGTVRTLFMGARSGDISSFGYSSPTGGEATVQLIAPNGTVRGTRTIKVESNVMVENNPAASLFGVAPEPGDILRVTVTSGVLQPYVAVQDPVTRDVALSLPVAPSTDAVIPNVASLPAGAVFWTSELQISNPDPTSAAAVVATYYHMGSNTSVAVGLTLPAGGSLAFDDVVSDLFQASGQGAIVLTSDIPVASSQRAALRSVADGSEYSCQSAALDAGSFVPAGGAVAIGVFATAQRHTNLLLFNRGAAGTVTITAFDGSGSNVGQLLLQIGDHQATRVNGVLAAAGGQGTDPGRIRVEASAGMQLFAQTVDVDGVTGDTELSDLR